MDNKQDRNFYWNIKDFMGKPHNPIMPQINPKNIKESINGVLNQNAVYKTTNFQSNITSARHISQAISAVERNNQKGTPDNIGNTKNITSNPFGVVNEGIFDDPIGALKSYGKAFVDGVKGVAEWGHGNALGSGETTNNVPSKEPLTQAQASQNNINVKNMSAKTLTPEQQKFEQSTSVPTAGDPNDPGDDSDDTDIRGDQEDRDAPKATPAGTPPPPPPPPPSDTTSKPTAQTQTSSGEDVSDKIAAQRKAYGMRRGEGEGGGKSGAAERTAARRARSEAIRDANIALRSTPEGEKTYRQQKAARGTKDFNFDVALRYAKPGQQATGTTPAPAGTIPTPAAPAAEEPAQPGFDPSKKQVSNRDGTIRTINPTPAPAGTIPTPATTEEPTQPGFDPSKKQVSNRDGTIRTIEPTPAPTQAPATTKEPAPGRAIDNLGMGSLPNNSGGLQNAEQPQPGFDPSKKQYSTRDGKIQTVNSKIAKMTATPKTSLA